MKFKYISNAEIQGVRKSLCLTQYSLLVILNSEGLVERPMGQDSTWHMSKFVGFSLKSLARRSLQSPDCIASPEVPDDYHHITIDPGIFQILIFLKLFFRTIHAHTVQKFNIFSKN